MLAVSLEVDAVGSGDLGFLDNTLASKQSEEISEDGGGEVHVPSSTVGMLSGDEVHVPSSIIVWFQMLRLLAHGLRCLLIIV